MPGIHPRQHFDNLGQNICYHLPYLLKLPIQLDFITLHLDEEIAAVTV